MPTIPSMVQVCTICLDTESKLFVMNKYKLEKAYENLIGYSICDEEHIMSKFLCAECMHRLVGFSKFRNKSLRARSVLEDLLRNYQQITVDYIKLVDRDEYQLKSDIKKSVFEPNHCDLYIDCSDTDVNVEGVAVKREERRKSLSIDEDFIQDKLTSVDHDANRQTKNGIFGDTIVKIERNVYKDHIDVESDIVNEYDFYYNTNHDIIYCDNSSDSTLVLDTKPTIEELLDRNQNSWMEDTKPQDKSSEPNNGHIKENTNHTIEDNKLDSVSTKKRNKLQEKLKFETTVKNFTQYDEFRTSNEESKHDDTKVVSRIKIDESSNYWESKSEEFNLLVKRETKQNAVKLKKEAAKPYSCMICNYKCKLKISLTVHMRTHKDDSYFSCKLCDYKSKLRHSINVHMIKHTAVKAYICDICDTRIKNKNNLTRHMKKHFGKTLACDICEYKTKIKRNLAQHMKQHTDKPFSCQLCDLKVFRKQILKMHMWSHTRETFSNNKLKDLGTNMTNDCDKISNCESKNSADKRNAESEKRYTCVLCSLKFLKKGHLNRHMLTHTGEKPFACSMCELRFTQKVSLQKHLLIHNKEKPFSCDVCPYKCITNIDMVKHKRTHTGEKPYACTYCDFRCNTSYNLVTHTRSHTGEKPFACKLCVYKCTRTSQLVRHMRTHTGEKRFKCDICTYKCTRQCNLLMHMRVHTGDLLSCDYCPYKTANKNCLAVHIKRHMQLIGEGKVNHRFGN